MKKLVAAITLLALVAGGAKLYIKRAAQQEAATRQREELKALRAPILATLKDPDSALWRAEKRLSPSEGVRMCGEFNAKNAMGGYVGYRRFISDAQRFMVDGESVSTWPLKDVLAMVPDDIRDAADYLATPREDSPIAPILRTEVFSWYWKTLCTVSVQPSHLDRGVSG